MEAFNPFDELAGFCWISDYPPGCSRPHRSDLVCTRGGDVYYLAKILASGTIALSLLIITTCMVLTIAHVWTTERKLRQYATNERRPIHKMTRQAAIQAFLYIGFFFFTMAPLVTIQMSPQQESNETASYYFQLSLVTEFVSPLQRFFNAFIYLRPQGMDVQRRLFLLDQVTSAWNRVSLHLGSWHSSLPRRRRTNSVDTDDSMMIITTNIIQQTEQQQALSEQASPTQEELKIEQLASLSEIDEDEAVSSNRSFELPSLSESDEDEDQQ